MKLGILGSLGGLVSAIYSIYQDQRNYNKMSPSAKEQLDFQDALEDENAEDAFRRSVQFQQDFLTPEAQLTSLAAGYEAVGLNKMGLAGYNAGASAATAPQSSAGSASRSDGMPVNIMDAMQKVLGMSLAEKQFEQQKHVQDTELSIKKTVSDAQARYFDSLATGSDINNETLAIRNQLELRQISENTRLLQEKVKSEPVQRRLAESGITLNEANAALAVREEALKVIEEKHKDKWLSLQNESQELQNQLQRSTNPYAARLIASEIRVNNRQANLLIEEATMLVLQERGQQITNDLLQKDYNNYDNNRRRQIAQDWIQTGAKVVGAVAAGAGAAGVLKGSAALGAGLSLPKSSPFDPFSVSQLPGLRMP